MNEYDQVERIRVEEVNRIQNQSEVVTTVPGGVVESRQCEGRIRKGLGRRCKARTRRSKLCQSHCNIYQKLRITHSKIPEAGLVLFSGERKINKNQQIVENTGTVWNEHSQGDSVLEANKNKLINAII